MFNEYGHFTGTLPTECVEDCSAQGSVDESVAYWRERLNFAVPRELAIRWLQDFGAWPVEGLQDMTDTEIAEKVLWLACCEIRENGEWFGLSH